MTALARVPGASDSWRGFRSYERRQSGARRERPRGRRAAEKRDEFLPPHGTFPSCRNSGRSEAITFAARSRSIAMWWAADSMRFDPATDARCEKLTMDPIGFGQRERLGIVVVAAFAVSAASVAYAKVYS